MKKINALIVPIVLLSILAVIGISMHVLANSQIGQQAAARWSSDGTAAAQISVFVSKQAKLSEEDIFVLRGKLDADSDFDAYIDCYSAKGSLTVSTDNATSTLTAYGVGGHFFFFHPLTLRSGAYFSDDSMMDDYIVLDEDSAWQLFGSTDIVGMEVLVGETPLVVAGVVSREDTFFSEAAGNTKPTVFVSYSTLLTLGSAPSISCYEIAMPNLTRNYAKSLITETLTCKNSQREIIENSSRYSLNGLFQTLKAFGTRSMQKKTIAYPYWENQARGVEDVCALLLLFSLLDACILVIYVSIKYILPFAKHRSKIHR